MPSKEQQVQLSGQDILRKKDPLNHEMTMNLLSGFGNHEAKALTLLSLDRNVVLGWGALAKQVIDSQGTVKGWRINRKGPFSYCQQSLEPIGLVAKEEIDSTGEWGYRLTDLGEEIGVPLAGLLLDFSNRYGLPLYNLLGSTSSPHERRGPQTRYEIFRVILSSRLPIRATDVFHDLQPQGERKSIHLRTLAANGLIGFVSAEDKNRPVTSFTLNLEGQEIAPPPFIDSHGGAYTRLTAEVAEIFRNSPYMSLTHEAIVESLAKSGRHITSIKDAKNMTSRVANHLAKVGFLEKSRFGRDVQSMITLSDEQRIILEDFISIIEGVQNQDEEVLARGRRLAREIQQTPQLFSDLMKRADESSPHTRKPKKHKLKSDIVEFVRTHPDCTNNEVRKYLNSIGIPLSHHNVTSLTASLTKSGDIKTELEGRTFRFTTLDDGAQSDSL